MKNNKVIQMNPYLFINKDVLNDMIDKNPVTDENIYKAIRLCQNPIDINVLINDYQIDARIIDLLMENKVLLPADKIWKQIFFHTMDIEINTHCNHRCAYCPEKNYPKKPQFMDNTLFAEIIEKASRVPSLTTIALNSYNEPLLDPEILQKLDIIKKTRLKVNLYTNASLLDPDKLDAIMSKNVIKTFYFNVPSLDEATYNQITGSNSYKRTIRNIEYAIQKNANVIIVVLGKGAERGKAIKEFTARYGKYSNVEIMHWGVVDKAGLLDNEYAQNIYIQTKLSGCIRYMNFLMVSVCGDFFICCQDYLQREIYGNIKDGEISSIVTSEKAIQLRKKSWGK